MNKQGFGFLFWTLLSIAILGGAIIFGVMYNNKQKAEQMELDKLLQEQKDNAQALLNATNIPVTNREDMQDYLDAINALTDNLYNTTLEIEKKVNERPSRGGGGGIAPVAPLY